MRKLCAKLVLIAALTQSLVGQAHPDRPHVFGIAHAAFRVNDLDRAELFYESLLGYGEPFSLADSSEKPTTAFVKVNDLQYVELFKGNGQFAGQLDHFALYTDDLTAMRVYLQHLGMYIAKDTHKGRIGNPFLTIRDPDGHFVEIVQYSPTSLTGKSQGKFMPATRISDHITHVGIVVNSLDLAMKFYHDGLGFREFAVGAGENGQPSWIALQVPDGSDYIELIPALGKVSQEEAKAQNHLGLASSDINRTVAMLRAKGPSGSLNSLITYQSGNGLSARAIILDPDRARIEIMEPLSAIPTSGLSANKQ